MSKKAQSHSELKWTLKNKVILIQEMDRQRYLKKKKKESKICNINIRVKIKEEKEH